MLCLSIGDDLVPYSNVRIDSVAKKKCSRLAPAVQHPARSLVIIVLKIGSGLLTNHIAVLLCQARTYNYDFYLWLLGKIPCHTDHIYDFGGNIGGRTRSTIGGGAGM